MPTDDLMALAEFVIVGLELDQIRGDRPGFRAKQWRRQLAHLPIARRQLRLDIERAKAETTTRYHRIVNVQDLTCG